MAYICGSSFGKNICKILGLSSDSVKSIHFKIEPDDVVLIDVKMYLTTEQSQKIEEILKSYTLQEL